VSVAPAFHHEALLYESLEGYLDAAVPFVTDGLEAGEKVLVAVDREKARRMREALGDDDGLSFVDMHALGRNPACIISAWDEFVSDAGGRSCRGIGEPLWPGRTAAERSECHRHEELLNHAFRDARGFTLMCPYDTSGLDPADVTGSCRSHPHLARDGRRFASSDYAGIDEVAIFDEPLADLAGETSVLRVSEPREVARVRAEVVEAAWRAGLGARARDAALAANEVVVNSLRHGGGAAEVVLSESDSTLVLEVRDRGFVRDPLAGRLRPSADRQGGRGLWLVHRLCDLVELRTSPAGTTVRLHLSA
jgi:anti-sigma regulatory factor (Ser/Thr protein kinase)